MADQLSAEDEDPSRKLLEQSHVNAEGTMNPSSVQAESQSPASPDRKASKDESSPASENLPPELLSPASSKSSPNPSSAIQEGYSSPNNKQSVSQSDLEEAGQSVPQSQAEPELTSREVKKARAGSMAAVMQGREPDPIPGTQQAGAGDDTSPDARLEKDYHKSKMRKEGAVDSTDEDRRSDSSEDQDKSSSSRGRQMNREKKEYRRDSNVSASDTDVGSGKERSTSGGIRKVPPRKLKTFEPLREKEESKFTVTSTSKLKSHSTNTSPKGARLASDPSVTVTGPGGEKITIKKGPVHPNTNYDRVGSRGVSPNVSDSEEIKDIKHAQSLSITASPIDNITPQRVIRNILRGDFRRIQEESKEKKRKLRTYFVATDISEEAAYALEWTIGTVLRDGDTLLAIYAVDEGIGTGKTGDPERIDGLELSEGAKAMQDTTATMEKMTTETSQSSPPPPGTSALAAVGLSSKARRDSDRGSKDSRMRTKGEAERLHAIDIISETCIKFLRKTRLQVRVTVEVISCKSPKHLITEAVSILRGDSKINRVLSMIIDLD